MGIHGLKAWVTGVSCERNSKLSQARLLRVLCTEGHLEEMVRNQWRSGEEIWEGGLGLGSCGVMNENAGL